MITHRRVRECGWRKKSERLWPITGYFLLALRCGMKTTKTKSRGYVGNSFALVAWMALATAEAQHLAPPPRHQTEGAKLAAEEVNKTGGVLGRTINRSYRTDGSG